ncbi:MAG: ATP-binding protein [Candidatus Methanoplasma sp.]|jgi:ATP-dependent DNA helicase RecG|nr:ATP-binding protein [Candidatus Methanoplasma sp.]
MESRDEEWKQRWKSEHLKVVSSFYNTAGGRMIIGKADDGTVIGVQNHSKLLKEIPDTISNVLGISADVSLEMIDGRPCIIVDVPKGERIIDHDGDTIHAAEAQPTWSEKMS